MLSRQQPVPDQLMMATQGKRTAPAASQQPTAGTVLALL